MSLFEERLQSLTEHYQFLLTRPNSPIPVSNGVFQRYKHPILTNNHVPLNWRYDLNPETNPYLMERLGVGAVFNAGAIKFNEKYVVVARVEGSDRKSFFAVAESPNGIDQFTFWPYPCVIPQTDNPDTNVYDMRLTAHEDGWIYGIFCTERKDPEVPNYDTSSAVAQAGIVRTKDLLTWERLPDLKSNSKQQRNVVLHPEFVNGKYALYTRPQDGFIEAGSGGGIGWALADSMENCVVDQEKVIDPRVYHTINEAKNGQGPAPIKTSQGWLHLAHGVRNTAAGLRYVLYLFLTDLKQPDKIIARPGGLLMGPEGEERIGDVSNVLFSNGWIADENGDVFIYYASSDTRLHVATTSIGQLLDYVQNTPPDAYRSYESVQQRIALIEANKKAGHS